MQLLLDLLERLIVWCFSWGHTPTTLNTPLKGLGRDIDTGDPVTLSRADLAKHLYILGSTGCGKTTLVLRLLEQDIKRAHSVVVLDLRGDLVTGALSLSNRLGVDPARVTLLDLRDKRSATSFNPLSGPGEAYIRALHVLDIVATESSSWGVQLEETLRSALLLLAYGEQPLTCLESIFYDRAFRNRCLRNVEDTELAHFWERFEAMGAERQQTFALPVLNKMTPLLAVPRMRQVFSGEHPLNLTETLNEKGHIFLVSLAVDELHRSSRMLGSLIISSIAREMMARVDLPESERNPVRLYVDEFENMASDAFEGIIAEGRRFGLALVLSHQTLSQLPAKLRSVIRNNVGIQILFQCGFEDATTVARELPAGISTDDIRALKTGEAYLMERTGVARLVKFHAPKVIRADTDLTKYRNSTKPSLPSQPLERIESGQAESVLEDDWL